MHTRRGAVAALVLGLAGLAGCGGGPQYAPVSGKVTLDGQPLASARINFQPIPPEGSISAGGAGSAGMTGPNGEYTLVVATGEKGAFVGRHRITISTLVEDKGDSDARPTPGWRPTKEKLPAKYNSKTTLTFDVPAAGTTSADFALESDTAEKGKGVSKK